MANINRSTLFALATLCGLATVALVYFFFHQQTGATGNKMPVTVQEVVARNTISPRTTVGPEMLAYRSVETGKQPSGAVTSFETAMGRVAVMQIAAGTPITADMLATKGPGLGLSFGVKEFHRAISVPIDPVSGVAGYLKPGDRVDVLATYTGSETNTARVVLQDVELLAIGDEPASTTNAKSSPNRPAEAVTATLSVDADQAAVLALTTAKAKIHLALRSPDDHAVVAPVPITTTKVFGAERTNTPPIAPAAPAAIAQAVPVATPAPASHPASKPVAKAPTPRKTVEVTRGTETQRVVIQ
jgi:pilus assembly protein CpaB